MVHHDELMLRLFGCNLKSIAVSICWQYYVLYNCWSMFFVTIFFTWIQLTDPSIEQQQQKHATRRTEDIDYITTSTTDWLRGLSKNLIIGRQPSLSQRVAVVHVFYIHVYLYMSTVIKGYEFVCFAFVFVFILYTHTFNFIKAFNDGSFWLLVFLLLMVVCLIIYFVCFFFFFQIFCFAYWLKYWALGKGSENKTSKWNRKLGFSYKNKLFTKNFNFINK